MVLASHSFRSLRLEGITREFGLMKALSDVSLTVQRGEFIALLGPSGCGKSTALNCLAGLLPLTGGAIWLDDKRIDELDPEDRGFGMVFQNYALFPHMSVRKNIGFGLVSQRRPKEEIIRRVDEALALVRLQAHADKLPGQLSGGQQQRVALGRAIVAEAPVCLMDEPLSNLDAQLRAEMRREILALQRRLGITMLFVTHDQTEAMSMADQIVLMRDGRIEQDAPPATIYARPATEFAARFIGTPPMNLFPLVQDHQGMVIAGSDGPVLARAASGPTLGGIRPEDLRLADAGITAHVADVEYLGADTVLACTVGETTLLARLPGRVALATGTLVHLAADTPLHLFDATTGRRIDAVAAATETIAA
jgi:sn-glycerol 3-phosphate transport system ATP-binding protein